MAAPVERRRLPASLAPLARRDFSLLWAGSLVSNAGSWMQTVAVGALVTAHTGRATWAVLVAAGAFLPIGVLSPLGGALADRLERRRWLIIGNLVETVLAGVLAALVYAGHAGPALVTFVVTVQGAVSALVIPFQQAILPDLVPDEELLAAASLNSAQFNMGRIIGPALAGVAVAAAGGSYGPPLVANAASFLAVVVALSFIRLPPPPGASEGGGLWSNVREGLSATRAQPGCRAAIGLISATALLASPFIALIPAVARHLTDGSARAVGSATAVLTTAQGVGAVAGALAVAPLALRFGRRRVLVAQLALLCAALVGYDAAPTLAAAAVALTAVGAIYIGVLSGLSTVVQLQAPPAYRGRILSLYFVALGVLYPIGALVQGPIADGVGLERTTITAAVILAIVLAVVRVVRPAALEALAADAPAQT